MSEDNRGSSGIESPATGHEPPGASHGAPPPRATSDEIRATVPARCCANCRCALPVEHKDETLLLCPCRGDRCARFSVVAPGDGCREFQPRVLPEQKEDEITRLIPLVNADGWYAMIDPADHEWLSRYTWRAVCGRGGTFYACTFCQGKTCYMHRMIMEPPEGMYVDHKNRCGLDNHRINLRTATHQQNCANRRAAPGASGFIGVVPIGDKSRAQISDCGKTLYLGLYDDPVEAARVRDRKAIELHGEFACLNFPQEACGRIVGLGGTIRARSGTRARLQCVTQGPARAGQTPARRIPSGGKTTGYRTGSVWTHGYRPSPFGASAPDGQRPLHRVSLRAMDRLSTVSWRTSVAEARPGMSHACGSALHSVRPLPFFAREIRSSDGIAPARPPPGEGVRGYLVAAWTPRSCEAGLS